MKAVIVAGGKGERLRPFTNNLPKPMLAVGGKPIIEHTLNLFKKNGITDFIISLCYLPDKITDYFGNGQKFGVSINYIFEDENQPLGTAGNIAEAKKYIKSTFIVTYADILRDLSISDMVKFHYQKKAFATLNAYKRFGENPKSSITFNNQNKITSFTERPQKITSDYVWSNGAFYVFEPGIFDFIPQGTFTDFGKNIFPKLLQDKKNLFAYQSSGLFLDIGSEEKLSQAQYIFRVL
jgi:NDP-sugar pyrophosphorylase family protein